MSCPSLGRGTHPEVGRFCTPGLWTTFPTPGWHFACNESGYTDSNISLQWFKRVFNSETKERANGRPRVLILDDFRTHETLKILEFCFANNMILCQLPSHTSHELQTCNIAALGPLKIAYREQVERLEQGGVNTIDKQHFTALYKPARERAFTPKNIKVGFAASGLFPFNPDRVLRTVPKPPGELTLAVTNKAPCQEDAEPQTPVTPVSAAGLASLQNLILIKDAHALDETSKQNLQRHLIKFFKATQSSMTKSALQQNHIQLLTAVNNEAKPRRSTKAEILEKGSGKVFTYEHLRDKRLRRAEEDAAREAKAKTKRDRKSKKARQEAGEATTATSTVRRGRKRKRTTLEVEANSLNVEAGPSVPKGKVARVSDVQAAEAAGVLWMAPVPKCTRTVLNARFRDFGMCLPADVSVLSLRLRCFWIRQSLVVSMKLHSQSHSHSPHHTIRAKKLLRFGVY
jgi:hypothetical protein